MDKSLIEAIQRAYDATGGAAVELKELPAAAKRQYEAEEKAQRADPDMAGDDEFGPWLEQLAVDGRKFYVVGRADDDQGGEHFRIYDAAGALVTSGGETERDGRYWD